MQANWITLGLVGLTNSQHSLLGTLTCTGAIIVEQPRASSMQSGGVHADHQLKVPQYIEPPGMHA